LPVWLLLRAELHFSCSLRPIFPRDYRADLLPEGSTVYYGVHFISAPAQINPGDHVVVEFLVRAFPIDSCLALQVGTEVSLNEGPSLVRAKGMITRRWEHETTATTIIELQRELGKEIPQ
jgi:hypothetical protein